MTKDRRECLFFGLEHDAILNYKASKYFYKSWNDMECTLRQSTLTTIASTLFFSKASTFVMFAIYSISKAKSTDTRPKTEANNIEKHNSDTLEVLV